MKPERWQQLDQLFHEALDRAPAERAGFLDEVCAGDELLRNQIEALLAAHVKAGSFIESPALEVEAQLLAMDQLESDAGKTIGHYKLISSIGKGGMGQVYLAQDMQLGRKVALKLLPAEFTRDRDRVLRFQQEARAASALNHPNIITIYDVGQADGRHFIATEFIDGETLRRSLDQVIQPDDVLNVGMQVADALAAAHAKGIVHRDIKPENIILVTDSHLQQKESLVKVLDFGIAKLTDLQAPASGDEAITKVLFNTHEGSVIGTASYMSPEQARGERVDGRTDIWSLGIVLYEMLSKQVPFGGDTAQDVIASILKEELPPLPPEVPDRLSWIVEKALRKNREGRYQTAREMFSDLRGLHDVKTTIAVDSERPQVPATSSQGSRLSLPDSVLPTGKILADKTSSSSVLISHLSQHKLGTVLALSALVIVVTGGLFGIKYLWGNKPATTLAGSFTKIKMSRLTTNGKARDAAISPDGKYVAHVKEEGRQSSLWLRHIATGSDQEIVPALGATLSHLTFSPDGNHIYFSKATSAGNTLHQVPVLGGAARELVKDIDTPVTLSPDGKRFAYLRGYPSRGEASLILANADGTAEQKLVTHKIGDLLPSGTLANRLAWSPDGGTVAFALKDSSAPGPRASVMEVRVKDGKEKQITFRPWSVVGAICWLPDGKGLIFIAADEELGSNKQIWHGSYPDGKVRRITTDLNDYQDLSLTTDASTLVTVQSEQNSHVWVSRKGYDEKALQITFDRNDGKSRGFQGGVTWTPDGRIVYVSRASGNSDIWIMNADGSASSQLTFDSNWDGTPSVSPDGRYVVFVSDRSGTFNIWRIDIDGSNAKQLTHGTHDSRAICAPDNQSVIYVSNDGENRKILKAPIDGGPPVRVTDYYSSLLAVSSKDGQLACSYIDEQTKRLRIGIIPFQGGPPTKTLDFNSAFDWGMSWTPDGLALNYIDTRGGISNLWKQRFDGSPPEQVTNFQFDQIFAFSWSRDGKQLALARGMMTNDVVLIGDLRDQE